MSDSITDEIRDMRHQLAAEFGNDLDLILADIRRRESTDGRVYVTLPARITAFKADEQSDPATLPVSRFMNGSSSPAAG